MIVSASYRTDIPAFYSEWFFNRLHEGYAMVRNPYSSKPYKVSLLRADVDGFVFWTRNFGPMLSRIDELVRFDRPFVVQFTVTGYPRALEAAVIPVENAVAQLHRLSREVHPLAPVWRYDPIVISGHTPIEFHRGNFRLLARRLEGAVDECVVSFVQGYEKSRRNLSGAGVVWIDPDPNAKRDLLVELSDAAREHGMTLTVCTQPEFANGVCGEARCIDSARLSAIGGFDIRAPLKGNRPGCACFESRDIGDYDTCPHGCAYCYAVRRRTIALSRYNRHDAAAGML